MNYLSPFWKRETRSSLFNDMDDLFNNLSAPLDVRNSISQPACDVIESDTHYLISIDLPGMKLEDIKVEVNNGMLCVTGERKFEKSTKQKDSTYLERSYGHFERSFRLTDGLDGTKIEAHYDNGVLNVALPKNSEARPKQVEIKTGKKPGFLESLLESKESKDSKKAIN